MKKIKVANPVVELDGDEMTRIIWKMICKNVPRLVPGWTKPIVVARHSYGDQYRATDFKVPGPGKLSITFTGTDGKSNIRHVVFDFPSAGVAMAMYNLDDSIRGFANACFNYGYARGY